MLIQIITPFVELVEGSLILRDSGDILDVSESSAERMIYTGTAVLFKEVDTPGETAPKTRVYRRRTE